MSNAHTYDKASEANKPTQQSENTLSRIVQLFFTLAAFFAFLNLSFFYFVKNPSQWEIIGLIAPQVALFLVSLFAVTIMDGWREAWKDIKRFFHG